MISVTEENMHSKKKNRNEINFKAIIWVPNRKRSIGCILSPCSFNLYAEYITQNVRLNEAQAGIKIAGRNINNLRLSDDTDPYGRKQRGTKEPLDESEKGE